MEAAQPKLATGIGGLDKITYGGYVICSTNLLRGGPGVEKTTIGNHFLLEGIKQNEGSLFITMGEPVSNIPRNAKQLGLSHTSAKPSTALQQQGKHYDAKGIVTKPEIPNNFVKLIFFTY